jgi:SAM-dependent methyltransferase
MKINIGAGGTKYNGFLNCDNSNIFPQDYIFDLEKDKFPFEDNSVTHVIAHHILEHLGDGYFHCLKELYRVCKNGAIIYIRVPHYKHDDFFHDPTHKRPITRNGFLFFDKEYCLVNSHYSFSKLALIYGVDFREVEYEEVLDRDHSMFNSLKDLDIHGILNSTKDMINVIQETRISLQVVK